MTALSPTLRSVDCCDDVTVCWRAQDGRRIAESPRCKLIAEDDHYTLLIYEVRPDDAGKYDCTLANKHGRAACSATLGVVGTYALTFFTRLSSSRFQGGYIFHAGGSLAGAGYCRQCRRRPAILPLQLWQGCQVCVKISAQRLPRVAQFNAC